MTKDNRLLDKQSLKDYNDKLQNKLNNKFDKVNTEINTLAQYNIDSEGIATLTSGVIKEYVDSKMKDAIEGNTVEKQVYYKLDTNGNIMYEYTKATGIADSSIVYYTQLGSGTTTDPYTYEVADPQPSSGDSLDEKNLFIRGSAITTTSPSEQELSHPVLDEQGDPVTESVTEVNESTESTIVTTMGKVAISEEEINDLFV